MRAYLMFNKKTPRVATGHKRGRSYGMISLKVNGARVKSVQNQLFHMIEM